MWYWAGEVKQKGNNLSTEATQGKNHGWLRGGEKRKDAIFFYFFCSGKEGTNRRSNADYREELNIGLLGAVGSKALTFLLFVVVG